MLKNQRWRPYKLKFLWEARARGNCIRFAFPSSAPKTVWVPDRHPSGWNICHLSIRFLSSSLPLSQPKHQFPILLWFSNSIFTPSRNDTSHFPKWYRVCAHKGKSLQIEEKKKKNQRKKKNSIKPFKVYILQYILTCYFWGIPGNDWQGYYLSGLRTNESCHLYAALWPNSFPRTADV